MVSIAYVGAHDTEGCFNCGEETCRWTDSDGSDFCTKQCAREWHGDDVKVVKEL